MKLGQSEIDFEANRITGPDGRIAVEPKVMNVLSVLLENVGEVVTRDQLIDQVWGVGYGGDERLSRAISILRKNLNDKGGKTGIIQTIPKVGYRLAAKAVDPALIKSVPAQSGEYTSEEDLNDNAVRSRKLTRLNWATILSAITAGLLVIAAIINYSRTNIEVVPPEPPLVIVMDSAHPARVYDDDVRDDGATNADILSDILADLPVRTQKELISPNWHRFESILQFEPDLILIHYSGFKQEDASGDRPQLRRLVEYFENTETEFLIYSRASFDWLDQNTNVILQDVLAKNPEMKNRIEIFPLLEYGEPHWRDGNTSGEVKLKVKEMLSIE